MWIAEQVQIVDSLLAAFEEARAQGVGELLADLKTHSKSDHRATVAMLAALDDRLARPGAG